MTSSVAIGSAPPMTTPQKKVLRAVMDCRERFAMPALLVGTNTTCREAAAIVIARRISIKWYRHGRRNSVIDCYRVITFLIPFTVCSYLF